MNRFEEYIQKPTVAKTRVEKLKDVRVLFLKDQRVTWAIMPVEPDSKDVVEVNFTNQTCTCGVFRTRRACPHVAVALWKVETNGGKIPYTKPVPHVFQSFEELKNAPSRLSSNDASDFFYHQTYDFLDDLPPADKDKLILQMALYLQEPKSRLTAHTFRNCYGEMINQDYSAAEICAQLYKRRQECWSALVALMELSSYECPFSETQRKTIADEIAVDDTLAAQYLPSLAYSYGSCFSRKQLLDYYKTEGHERIPGKIIADIMKRLVEEEPPMYEEFLKIANEASYVSYDLQPSTMEKMIQAGFLDQMDKLLISLVRGIGSMEDYFQLIQVIPHDAFLKAWRNRDHFDLYSWKRIPSDVELEIQFRVDPETDIRRYNLENLSFRILRVIQSTHPEYCKGVNDAARKRYRSAVKAGDTQKAMDALMVLAQGGDPIAVKYALEWGAKIDRGDDLVYMAAVGTKFDSMQKVAPEMKKLEVAHASGQTR